MMNKNNPALLILMAFIAGFLSVLFFHQPTLIVLKAISLAPEKFALYSMAATSPLGIPRVFSLAFWGGIWGIAFVLAVAWTSRFNYWLSGLIIGALGPSLVNWLVVQPLKGEPIGGGWAISGIITALIVNGIWGVGTVLFCRLLGRNLLGNSRQSAASVKREREKINR